MPETPQKREHSLLSTKQHALRLLGARRDGTFGPPSIDENTGKEYTVQNVARLLKINRTAVYNWKRTSGEIMQADVEGRGNKKKKLVSAPEHPELEQALSTYLRYRAAYLRGESLSRENAVRKYATDIRDEMVAQLTQLKAVDSVNKTIDPKISSLQSFKGSKNWFYNYISRNRFATSKPLGHNETHGTDNLHNVRKVLTSVLCQTSPAEIAITDEVAVLYRSLPTKSGVTNNRPASNLRVKDRLTAVLTVYANGDKGPLVVIGKSSRPESFPKNFIPERDLGVFYYGQNSSWNTQLLWSEQMKEINRGAREEGRRILHLVDDCSAHSVDYSAYETMQTHVLPENMTSAVQPLYATVRRAFKVAYRRLLAQHVLDFVKNERRNDTKFREAFKMSKAVTDFDAVKLMASAWNLIPTNVVINAWLSCRILAPYQELQLKDTRSIIRDKVSPAKRPHSGAVLESEKTSAAHRAQVAKDKGELFLKTLDSVASADGAMDTGEEASRDVEDGETFYRNSMASLAEEMKDLQKVQGLGDLDVGGLKDFFDDEERGKVCLPIEEDTAVRDVVRCVLEDAFGPLTVTGDSISVDDDSEDEQKPSLSRFLSTAAAFRQEVQLVAAFKHPAVPAQTCQELLQLIDTQSAAVTLHRRRESTQKG